LFPEEMPEIQSLTGLNKAELQRQLYFRSITSLKLKLQTSADFFVQRKKHAYL
jgi:hypothetical protein